MDGQFEDLMKDIDFDEMAFAVPDGRADDDDASMRDDASDKTEYDTYLDDDDDDPMAQLRKNPTVRNLVTVTFTRDEFLKRLDTDGLAHPTATYRMFDAEMDVDGKGALKPIDAAFDLRDSRFSPAGSQEEPELSDIRFDDGTAQLFGCENMMGLSIQRVDLLQRAVGSSIVLRKATDSNRWPKPNRPWTSSIPYPIRN